MKRGEIWIGSAKSDFAGKPRPLLIIQSEFYSNSNSVTICPITSEIIHGIEIRPLVLPNSSNGLLLPSQISIDKITTMTIQKLSKPIGIIDPEQIPVIDLLLIRFFGISIK